MPHASPPPSSSDVLSPPSLRRRRFAFSTNRQRRAAALLLASLLGAAPGCHSPALPSHLPPTGAAPSSFHHSSAADRGGPNLPPSTPWWRLFNDPQLDTLESAATTHSPTLAAAAARLTEARARLQFATGDRRPSVTGNANSRLLGESSERSLPIPGHPLVYRDSGDTYHVSLDASYEFDFWGRVRHSLEAASAQVEATEADLATARLSLSVEVAQAWLTARALETEARLLDSQLALRRDQLGLQDSRLRAGLSTALDSERTRLEIATYEGDRADVVRRRESALDALRALCGTDALPLDLSPFPVSPAGPLVPEIPAGLPSDLLKRRPDIVSAERTFAARLAEVGLAQAAFFPSLRLTASAGLESPDLLRLVSRPSEFWQLGPSLTVPLFTGGKNQANFEIASARFEAATNDYDQKVLNAFRDVDDALNDLGGFAAQAKALDEAHAAAATVSTLSEARHKTGLVSYFEVIEARKALLANERAALQLDSARRLASLRLIKALGGTW